MTAEEAGQIEKKLHTMNKKELRELVLMLLPLAGADDTERMAQLVETQRMMTGFAVEYRKLEQERDELKAENAELKRILTLAVEKEQLANLERFGCSSETLAGILKGRQGQEEADEATEPAIDDSPDSSDSASSGEEQSSEEQTGASSARRRTSEKSKQSAERKKKEKGKKEADLSRLRHETRFAIDTRKLDREYGEGNWHVAFWKKTTRVEHAHTNVYAVDIYTPKVIAGPDREIHSVPAPPALIPGSVVSATLMAEILFMKFFLAVPLYRLEYYFADAGYPLSRQTMSNWVVRIAYEIFGPLFDYLKEELLKIAWHQCDETTYRVLRDGRGAGSRSYIWVHTNSELQNVHPIVIFCYELTRGTDHLREFYKDFEGYITCDAYCSYQVLEKENEGIIFVCGCMMHMRRRYADSLALIDISNLSDEQLEELPEVKALRLIAEIYAADEALKTLSCEERAVLRQSTVRPLVEKYYEYIEGIDLSDSQIRNRLKDAVSYSINQKEHLCRFLDDGNIPIDNGNSERKIRPLCIGRRNFLFCNTIDGAIAMAIMYSIVETAKANKANVLWYLQYVLERVPMYLDGTDRGFLPSMMPWAEEYREYERKRRQGLPVEPLWCEFDSEPDVPRKPAGKTDRRTA